MTQLAPGYLCDYGKGNPFVKMFYKYFDVQYHNKRNAVNAGLIIQPLGTGGADGSPALQTWTEVLIGTRGFVLSLCLFDGSCCCFVSSLMFFYVAFVNDLLLKWYNSERFFFVFISKKGVSSFSH